MTIDVENNSIPKALVAALAGLVVNFWVFGYTPNDAIPAVQKLADLWRHAEGPLAAAAVLWLFTSVKKNRGGV